MESQKLELRWSWQCEQGRSRRRNEYGSFLIFGRGINLLNDYHSRHEDALFDWWGFHDLCWSTSWSRVPRRWVSVLHAPSVFFAWALFIRRYLRLAFYPRNMNMFSFSAMQLWSEMGRHQVERVRFLHFDSILKVNSRFIVIITCSSCRSGSALSSIFKWIIPFFKFEDLFCAFGCHGDCRFLLNVMVGWGALWLALAGFKIISVGVLSD